MADCRASGVPAEAGTFEHLSRVMAQSSTDPLSPSSERSSQRRDGATYSDRYIPSRRGVNLQDSFALLPDSQPQKRDAPQEGAKDDNLDTYTMLLRSELLGNDGLGTRRSDEMTPERAQRNLFRYRTLPVSRDENAAFALSPVGSDSQRVLCSPRKVPRKISTVPYKVLDAPALQAPDNPQTPPCPPALPFACYIAPRPHGTRLPALPRFSFDVDCARALA